MKNINTPTEDHDDFYFFLAENTEYFEECKNLENAWCDFVFSKKNAR
jgi:hypothetical protein